MYFFTDFKKGYEVGTGLIIKTINGGNNWVLMISGKNLSSVFFTDVNTGYVVGDTGVILKTTDAGTNWLALSSGTTQCLRSVSFINQNTGIAVGDSGTILKTTDGGANWTLQTVTGGYPYLYSVCFADSNTAYVVGCYPFGIPFLCKTTDCGISWQTITIAVAYQHLRLGVFFPTTDIGFAVGSNASIFKYSSSNNVQENKGTTEINIYPNPAKDNITIESNSNIKQKMEIVNLLGQTVYTGFISSKACIDIASFTKGIYILKLSTDKEMLVQKFIKK